MFREVKWSTRALFEWVEILEYWIDRNQSNTYSNKLDHILKAKFHTVAKSSSIGRPTDYQTVRVKIVRHYMVYYRIEPESIQILTIWDSRRNPSEFK